MTERSVVALDGGEITTDYGQTFEGDGYIQYLGCCDGFMGVHTCQNLSNCTFQIYAVYHMSIYLNKKNFLTISIYTEPEVMRVVKIAEQLYTD